MGIHESFSSQVETSLANLSVSAVSSGKAVKKLISSWQITAVEDHKSDITFAVDYEMKSHLLQVLLSGMFDHAAKKVMGAFEARAETLQPELQEAQAQPQQMQYAHLLVQCRQIFLLYAMSRRSCVRMQYEPAPLACQSFRHQALQFQ
jgi:hypothetical protein